MTALVDVGMVSPSRVAALLAASLSVVSVYREAVFGIPLAAGALASSDETQLLGRPLSWGQLKLQDARGQRTAPGIAGELQALAPDDDRKWQSTGTRARWRSDGQLQHLGGSRGASFAERPAEAISRDASTASAQAMTAGEREMHAIWCDLLGRSEMGLDDNFFDLGGYSLLAMNLVATIETRMGKKIQPASLLEAPTIRRLSALVERSRGQSSLLKLRPGAGGPGVFFIHDVDGEVLLYRNLAMRLHARHPIYALRPHGDDEFPILHTRISEMADHYVKQIRGIQPDGPYILAGLCAGGEIAFEVACRLQAQDQQIATLALFESTHANVAGRPGLVLQRRLAKLKQALNANQGNSALPRLAQSVFSALRLTASVLQYEVRASITRAKLDAELRRLRRTLDKGERPGPRSSKLTVRQVVSYAQRTAQCHGRLAGNVLLLRATSGDGTKADQPYREIFADPLFGWAAGVQGNVVVADVDGGHSSILREPFVTSTHAVMQTYIDAELSTVQGPHLHQTENIGADLCAAAPDQRQIGHLFQT
jgi:thioesterase domain-containing protein/acyl carrier protein